MPKKGKRQAARKSSPTAEKTRTALILPRRTRLRNSVLASPPRQPVSDRSFDAKQKAFHAIAKMRSEGASLKAASRDVDTSPATVKKYLRAALFRSKSGKWKATKSDRYARPLKLLGPLGYVTVRANGSVEAELASAYSAALARWAGNRRASDLAPFVGKKVGGVELLTSPRALRALGDAGLLQLDSLYASLKDTV